jgi:hypothetical protein
MDLIAWNCTAFEAERLLADFRLWHRADVAKRPREVRFRRDSGQQMLRASFSAYDLTGHALADDQQSARFRNFTAPSPLLGMTVGDT